MPLETHIHSASERGLSSITTLITGTKSAILIDPPFLLTDAASVITWIKKTTPLPLKAIFVTHHHPDHFFSANPILEAWPAAKFLAASYVRAGIDREYDEKVKYWSKALGEEHVPAEPRKPEVYDFSFVELEGDEGSPVLLLGPLQGDAVDHTLFWLPTEKTLITGDAVYARSTHVWVEEVETPFLLSAWQKTLSLISALAPTKLIPGHLEAGWTLDAQADLAHTRAYLDLFSQKVTFATEQSGVHELYETFKDAFPAADRNLEFFLGHLSNRFGIGGAVWEENRLHGVDKRTGDVLEGFVF